LTKVFNNNNKKRGNKLGYYRWLAINQKPLEKFFYKKKNVEPKEKNLKFQIVV
jgi:hypothetical protein